MKVESNNNINEFLRWSYILSYLNIKDEDYYFADNILIVKRIEIFSKVEVNVVKEFCERRKYTYEVECADNINRIIIYLNN